MSDDEKRFIEQVVGPNDLYNQTSVGWEVVERFDHDEAFEIREPVPPDQQQNYGYQPTFTRTQLGRVSSFRIRRAVDSPIAALSEQVQSLHLQSRAEADGKKKAEESLGVEVTKHQRTRAELKAAQEYTERMRGEREQIESIKRQLERDLGKVREHIGRKLFDEILPPTAATQGKENP